MKTKLVWIGGSLLGGILIHLVVAGCSSSEATTTLTHALDTQPAQADTLRAASTTKTADTDSAQLRHGVVPINASATKLAAGPVILTDFQTLPDNTSGLVVLYAAVGATCPDTPTTDVFATLYGLSNPPVTTGARFFVPAGSVLCAATGNGFRFSGLSWSGFVPYP